METGTRLGRTGAFGGPSGLAPGGVRRQEVILVGALLGSFLVGWAATSLIVERATSATPVAATGARGQTAAVVRTAPATLGSISAELSYASAVQPTQQVSVTPRAVGVVQDILVDVGQTVHKGDVLAVLDQTNAQAQVQQAQAGLQAAQAKLAQVQAGARPEDIAAAQAQVAQAQARLAGLVGGRPEDVNAAQAQLDAAQAKLDQLQHPLPADVEAAQQSVTSAQAAYDAAVRAAGTDSTQLLSLRAAMEKAAADLQAAQAKYDQVANRSDIASRPEATALQQATITYQQAKVYAWSETGTSSTAMSFGEQKRDSLVSSLGWQAEGSLGWARPYARITWEKDYNNDDRTVRAGLVSTGGIGFGLPAFRPDDNYVLFDVGLSGPLGNSNVTGFVSVNATAIKNDGNYQAITVGVRVPL